MLPPELLLHVSAFLSTADKCSFVLVCRSFSVNVRWSDEERVEQLLALCSLRKDICTFSAPQIVFDSALGLAARCNFCWALALLEHEKVNPRSTPGIQHLLFSEVATIEDVDKLLDDPRLHPRHGVASVMDGGKLDILHHVLEDGRLNPSAENNASLLLAVQYGDPVMVAALLASDKVQATTEEILAAALNPGSAAVFQTLSVPLPLRFEGWPEPRRI